APSPPVLAIRPRRSPSRPVGRGVAFVLAGMFFHFTWDDAGGLGFGNGFATFGVMLASTVLSFTVLRIAFRRAAPREHQFVRDILAPEVEAGTLTPEKVDSVLDKKARKHLGRAVLDLTHDLAEARGHE